MDILTKGPIVVLSGDFDARSTSQVRSAINERLADTENEVVVDLSRVRAVDVPALRVLAYASHAAPRSGHHVRLRGCSPQVVRMLLLTRLMRFVQLDRDAA